jgi:hypothetical protein
LNNKDGRHIQGGTLFDYWHDPDGFLVEHLANGEMFNSTPEPGGHCSPFRVWCGADLRLRQEAISRIESLCSEHEFDINRFLRLKEANSLLSQSFEPTAPGGSKLPPAQSKSPPSPSSPPWPPRAQWWPS